MFLFIMGLGMGGTMMPLFTSALKNLAHHEVARGSTLLNVTQQISSSIGVAVMSVILTNHFKSSDLAYPAMAAVKDPSADTSAPNVVKGLADAAASFADTYWVALSLVVLKLIPVYFLPRKHEELPQPDDEDATPVMVH